MRFYLGHPGQLEAQQLFPPDSRAVTLLCLRGGP